VGNPARLSISWLSPEASGDLRETSVSLLLSTEMTMKTLVTALTAAVLLAGVGAANAYDQQITNTEIDNQLNHEFSGSGAYASGAYASARLPVMSTVGEPEGHGDN
jgi:hypothetical protein